MVINSSDERYQSMCGYVPSSGQLGDEEVMILQVFLSIWNERTEVGGCCRSTVMD